MRKKLWSVTRIKHPKYPGYTVRVGEYEPLGTLHAFRWVNGRQTSQSLACRRADLGTSKKAQEQKARQLACDYIEELVTRPSVLRSFSCDLLLAPYRSSSATSG